jgi:hypothetical protein
MPLSVVVAYLRSLGRPHYPADARRWLARLRRPLYRGPRV